MKKVLLLSPTHREKAQIPAVAEAAGIEVIFDEFDENYFDNFLGENPDFYQPKLDIVGLIEQTILKYKDQNLSGVTSAVGYPGMSASSVIAQSLGLPGPPPDAVMLCEHKYFGRVYQKQHVPDATPDFHLIDPTVESTISDTIEFPCFLKPVKSCMSKNAYIVNSKKELHRLIKTSLLPHQFIDPFNDMLKAYSRLRIHASNLLQEELLQGVQVSLEGYVFENQVNVLGIVDAIMFPGTYSFKRFQYPSQLPKSVLDRMIDVAERFFSGIGYNNAMFNMELFYDRDSDKVSIIEINPKIASQFPNLFEKVDGFSSYRTMLEIAAGIKPKHSVRMGRHNVAASCVLRTFEDYSVKAVPTEAQRRAVIENFPDTQIQIYATPGKNLSDNAQDAMSYRYGLIDMGAPSVPELEAQFEAAKRMLTFEFEPVVPRS